MNRWAGIRLVKEGMATVNELKTVLSIDEVFDLNDALDAWHEAERALAERQK